MIQSWTRFGMFVLVKPFHCLQLAILPFIFHNLFFAMVERFGFPLISITFFWHYFLLNNQANKAFDTLVKNH